MDEAWLYALGHAQQQTGVSLHCAAKVINHHHIDITDNEEKRPEFLRLFHGDLSCALNTLLGRERYDQPGQLLDDRPTHCMRTQIRPRCSRSGWSPMDHFTRGHVSKQGELLCAGHLRPRMS